jgi:hypothetical protein
MLGATEVKVIVRVSAREVRLLVAAEMDPRIAAAGKEDRVVVRMLVAMRTRIIAKAFAMVVGSAKAALLRIAAAGKEDRAVVRMLVAMRTRITAKIMQRRLVIILLLRILEEALSS